MLDTLTKQLSQGTPLTEAQVIDAVQILTGVDASAESKADFLTALAQKGESIEEITSFARAMRGMSIKPPLDESVRNGIILDVCGTGGDRLNTFNISTTVALVMAAAGVYVAKHGNRAITSQAGSADVLEALGIKIELTPSEAAASLRNHHFAFFFALNFHPAFKQIAAARKLCAERKQRTVFNFLGPLLNPAHPTAQLVGVPRQEMCVPIATVLRGLGVKGLMVVCGEVRDGDDVKYLDEISTLGPTHFAGVTDGGISLEVITPKAFPVQPVALSDLQGADPKTNARIVQSILLGKERGPKRDAVLINCAAAMVIAGKSKTLLDGWEMAAEIIDSGAAERKLLELTNHQTQRML